MKVRIHTESGSTYVLDKDAMTWQKRRWDYSVHRCQVEEGQLYAWPDIALDRPLIMISQPDEFGSKRYTRTTLVTSIEERP